MLIRLVEENRTENCLRMRQSSEIKFRAFLNSDACVLSCCGVGPSFFLHEKRSVLSCFLKHIRVHESRRDHSFAVAEEMSSFSTVKLIDYIHSGLIHLLQP